MIQNEGWIAVVHIYIYIYIYFFFFLQNDTEIIWPYRCLSSALSRDRNILASKFGSYNHS